MIKQFTQSEKDFKVVAPGQRIEKGHFQHFKTGNNTQECVESGDVLIGIVTNDEDIEVLATMRYNGGGIADIGNYTILNSQSLTQTP